MILLVGKTCSGKDTIKRELLRMGMEGVVTYTTRPPRKNEIDGVSYHFISSKEFLEKEKQGFFAETTSYNVASGETWYYGSALEDLTDDKVIIVNPHGLKQIRKIKSLNPIVFYITVDENIILDRLKNRGDNPIEAERRLKADNKDFADIGKYVDFSLSNDIGLSPQSLAEVILYTYKKVMGDDSK